MELTIAPCGKRDGRKIKGVDIAPAFYNMVDNSSGYKQK